MKNVQYFLLENAKTELPLFPPSVLVKADHAIWLEITKGLFFWANIWWWIHYFIWGWTGKFCCYAECFGLPIVCLNSVMFIKTDLEQGFLSFSCTECQVCPCQIIQKMNLSYIFILISQMLHWWKWVLSQHSFKKLIEIPNYCRFPTLCTAILDLETFIFYLKWNFWWGDVKSFRSAEIPTAILILESLLVRW